MSIFVSMECSRCGQTNLVNRDRCWSCGQALDTGDASDGDTAPGASVEAGALSVWSNALAQAPRNLTDSPKPGELPTRQTHGCFTLWLMLVTIIVPLGTLYNLGNFVAAFNPPEYGHSNDMLTVEFAAAVLICNVFQVAGVIGIHYWKRWGVFLLALPFIGGSLFMFVNSQGSVAPLASMIIGVGIMATALNIGGRKRAWIQMD